MHPDLKVLLKICVHNVGVAVRYLSGRQLSMAELGTIQHHVAVAIRAAYLRGKLAVHTQDAFEEAPTKKYKKP